MKNSLNILLSGVVGVNPRILFLETDQNQATVFSAGFINEIADVSGINIQKGDFIFVLYDNGTKQEMAVPEFGVDNVITLLPVAGDINTGGPINGGINLGFGEGVFASVAGSLMQFKSLVAGTGVSLTSDGNSITINNTNTSTGTINDGQNIGTGDGIFSAVSGDKLQFKTITAGANIVLTPGIDELNIAATSTAGGTINTGTNLGTGTGVYSDVAGDALEFKTLKGGSGVVLTDDATSITITATGGGGGGDITGGVNLGSGTGVFAGTVVPNLEFKSLVAGPNISLSNDANTVTITGTGGGGSNFQYQNTFWVASNGNNANSGRSINEPIATFAHLQTLLPAGQSVCINVVDSGNYLVGGFTIAGDTLINAPDASFTYTGATNVMFNAPTNMRLDMVADTVNGAGSLYMFAGYGQMNVNLKRTLNSNIIYAASSIVGSAPVTFNIVNTDASGGAFILSDQGYSTVSGHYLGASTFVSDNLNLITINADYFNGFISGTGNYCINAGVIGPALTNNATGNVEINATRIDGNLTNTANALLVANVADAINGTVTISTPGVTKVTCTTITGDIIDTGASADGKGYVHINCRTLNGDISSSNKRIYGNIQTINGTMFFNAINSGFFNGNEYLNQYPVLSEIYSYIFTSPPSGIWSYLPGYQNGNQQIVITNTDGVFTLPQGSSVPQGWRMTAIQTVRSSGATVQVQAPDTFNGQFNTGNHCYTGAGKAEFIRGPANGSGGYVWVAAGNVFQVKSAGVTGEIFVSQFNGDDTTGDGTFENPVATINAALTIAGAPSSATTIVITDDATYDEQVHIANPNINLIGLTAQLSYSGLGDALTVDHTALVTLGTVAATGGGNSIVFNGGVSEALVGNISSVTSGGVVNNGAGITFLRSFALLTSITAPSGQVKYNCNYRAPSLDGAGVVGTSSDTASGDWTVAGNISGNNVSSTNNVTAGGLVTAKSSVISGQPGYSGNVQVNPFGTNTGAMSIRAADNTANVITVLQNQPTNVATIHALPHVPFGNVTLLPCILTTVDPMSNIIYFDTTVTAAQIAGGASISLVSTFFGGQYRIRDLRINQTGTNFSGGGGDRDLEITDGITQYSVIPAASLQALSNSLWGSVNLPPPATASWNTLTWLPGVNLNARYVNGTTDYAVGAITISGAWERVT